jgi:hypothetical protein
MRASAQRMGLSLCLGTLLIAGCSKVPRDLIERQIALDDPRRAGALEHLTIEIYDAADSHGLMVTQPVTDADRANGVDARYLVRWTAITQRTGVAGDVSGTGIFTHLSSGEWVTNKGIFGSDGHPRFTKNVEGTYRGRYAHYGQHLDCTMTLGGPPDYAGTYACSGEKWRGAHDDTLVPANFTGQIALFAVFQPDSVPVKAGLLNNALHNINPYDRKTRALVFATNAEGEWQVATAVEEKSGALGIGFAGASGIGSETDAPLFFHRRTAANAAAPTPQNAVAASPTPSSPREFTAPSSNLTYQPAAAAAGVSTATQTDDLPGRPYPNPPPDAETRAAINSFLGQVMDGRHRTIDILGYRKSKPATSGTMRSSTTTS